jgi:hypothetical protein
LSGAQRARSRRRGVRIASDPIKDGHWLRLSYEGGRVRPEWFGSRQRTADHSTLIQAAIAFVVAEGSGRVDLGNSTYHCKSRIVLDPTRCILAGSGAVLDFSDRVAPSDTPVVDLERLRGMAHGSWSVAPKGLVHTPYEFTELAVPLEMTAGGRYRVTYKIDQLAGDPNNPFVRLQVYCDGLQDPVASLPTSAPDRIALEFEERAARAEESVARSGSERARGTALLLHGQLFVFDGEAVRRVELFAVKRAGVCG